jgi:predicted transcriptional regulator of viral defense system
MQKNASEILVDLPDALWLQDHFSNYSNPKAKIGLLIRQNILYRLKRGLYIKAAVSQDPYVLGKAANRIYGPSYVSFAYALRWHGLIPEHVAHITSATYGKGRSKRYDTPVGSFLYQDVPAGVYSHGVTFAGGGQNRFLMASPEKAVCDALYRASGVRSMSRLEQLLFEDLRLDPEAFKRLDLGALIALAGHYKTATLNTLAKFARKMSHA